LEDAGWCAWIGNMRNANRVQGFMQACYSLGATLSPLIATSMFTTYGLPWYSWYYVMTAAAGLELIVCAWAFWHKDGPRYRRDNPRTSSNEGSRTREAITHRVTWMCAAFFFCVSAFSSLPFTNESSMGIILERDSITMSPTIMFLLQLTHAYMFYSMLVQRLLWADGLLAS